MSQTGGPIKTKPKKKPPGKNTYGVYVKPKARPTLPVRSAVNKLNERIGGPTKTVKVVKKKKKADAVIGYSNTKNAGLHTPGKNGRPDRIEVNKGVRNTTPKSSSRRLVQHEIGHGLGLEHRTGAKNVMNPNGAGKSLRKRQTRRVLDRKAAGKYK